MAEVSWEPLVYLDANIFIDAYEGEPRVSELAKSLLDELRKQPGTAVTSELSLAEVLVRPEAERNLIRKRAYLGLIIWSRFVSLVPITRDLLLETAKLRRPSNKAPARGLHPPSDSYPNPLPHFRVSRRTHHAAAWNAPDAA
jgi:hypothetical protein